MTVTPTARVAAQIPDAVLAWPDILYVNGRIVTFDDTKINNNPGSVVESMAVRDEKIIALGSRGDIIKMKGPKTKVVDLKGANVLPGLIDSHNHIQGPAARRATRIFKLSSTTPGFYVRIKVAKTPKETLAKIKKSIDQLRAAVKVGKDDWISVELLRDRKMGYPSIATVSHLMDTKDPKDAKITQGHLDAMVSDRMFLVHSAAGIQRLKRMKTNQWLRLDAGPDGKPVRKPLFMVKFSWLPRKYRTQPQPPAISQLALDHERGIIAADTPASHRINLLNSYGYKRTKELWPDIDGALTKDARGMKDAAKRGLIKSSPLRGELQDIWKSKPTPAQFAEGVKSTAFDLIWKLGVTQISTRLDEPFEVAGFYNLWREEKRVPYRIGWHYEHHRLPAVGPAVSRSVYTTIGNQSVGADYNPWIWLLGVGSEGDGDSVTRACLGPDLPALPGKEIYVKEELERCPPWVRGDKKNVGPLGEGVWKALNTGWRMVGLHGIGSHMIRLFVHRLEDAMKMNPDMTLERVRAARHGFSHGTMIGKVPEVMAMARKYNLYLPVDVARSIRDETEAIDEFYGPEGYEFQAPIASMIDAGVKVLADADASFEDVGVFVTRHNPDTKKTMQPKEKIDRVTSYKLHTIVPAEFNFSETVTGNLEVGKFADFIVIDKDFLDSKAVPDDKIGDIKVLMTVISGAVVWTSDAAPEAFKKLPHVYGRKYKLHNKANYVLGSTK
ncbi:MAG: amidohydrolase family protein [Alphaproteobacteria bacterium]|nr:amidohydrolase family protein [Alphaproteobacteria bacterium]